MNKYPLVSVVVISYNSDKTVIETLESIKNQTYSPSNIELVISDDGSKDNTREVVDSWLQDFGDGFFSVKINYLENNLGVSSNCNSAFKLCSAGWVKIIAADDILKPNCISDYVDFVLNRDDVYCVFSKMDTFGPGVKSKNSDNSESWNQFFNKDSALDQYQYMLLKSFNIAPSSFLNVNALIDVGYCDEKYTLIEDLPLWLKLLKKGYKFYLLETTAVKYRVGNSISNKSTAFTNYEFKLQLEKIYEEYVYPNLKLTQKWVVFDRKIELISLFLISSFLNNKVNFATENVYRAFLLLRPSFYLTNISKILSR